MHIVDTCEPVQPLSAIAGMHRDHLARRRRIEAAAVGAKPVDPADVDNQQVVILEQRWAERQKAGWFSIVSEIGPPRIEDIIRATCKHFAVTKLDLLSARRTRRVTLPRQVGYYLSKMLTKHSLPEIGRRFGNRDHTSALSGIRKIERLRATDPVLDADIREISSSLGEHIA